MRFLPILAASLLLPLSTFADSEVVNGIEWTYTILLVQRPHVRDDAALAGGAR